MEHANILKQTRNKYTEKKTGKHLRKIINQIISPLINKQKNESLLNPLTFPRKMKKQKSLLPKRKEIWKRSRKMQLQKFDLIWMNSTKKRKQNLENEEILRNSKNNGKKIAKQACKGRNKEKNLEMKHENGDINETIGN